MIDPLFGKYCYIDTPWIAGEKTVYKIVRSGVRSNGWREVPVKGRGEVVLHDWSEAVVFVVLDTLIDETSKIEKFALKDIELINEPNNCEDCKHWDCIKGKWECVLNECHYKPKTEPLDKDTNVRSKEPQTDAVALDKATLMDYLINSVDENDEPVWTERHIDEILKDFDVVPKTEPQIIACPIQEEDAEYARWLYEQTDYERGRKDAWDIAQKVFGSTVTLYEAEDVAKQIAKDEPQTKCDNCKTYWNCQGQCDEMPQIEDEPQTDCAWGKGE